MRLDNYAYFTDVACNPVDDGSKDLDLHNKLPRINELRLNEIYTLPINKKFHFIIPIKQTGRVSLHITEENLKQVFEKLKELLLEKQINSISIAKTEEIELIKWKDVLRIMKENLGNLKTKVIVCLGILEYPALDARNKIISDHHDTLHAGHRGRNKTLVQIKQKFKWEKMKEDVDDYIRKD